MRHQHFHALGDAGFHRIAYTDWGQPANPPALMSEDQIGAVKRFLLQ